jgi:hypothetical protein
MLDVGEVERGDGTGGRWGVETEVKEVWVW